MHNTPHVFAPTDDEFEVKYRCLLCGCSGHRRRTQIVPHRTNKPKPQRQYHRTAGRKPDLDWYDRNLE